MRGLRGNYDPEELLRSHGWEAEVRQPGEAGANFGRWRQPVMPRGPRAAPRTFLIGARRTASM
jgi:hypothetical protein